MRVLRESQDFLQFQLSKISRFDGRWLLAIILVTYFMPILLATNFFNDFPDKWKHSRYSIFIYPLVPKMMPPFADLRVITAGSECIRLGYDVLITNPCDPLNRPMNYPDIWSIPASWGLDQSHTVVLGILLGLLFFISAFIVIGRLNYCESLLYALIFCSPSIMFAVERGNNDLLVFILLTFSLILIKRRASIWRSFGYSFILFAAILKLYPIFSMASCLKEEKRNFTIIFTFILAIFMAYVVSNFERLVLVSRATPRPTGIAYGGKVIFDIIFSKQDRLNYLVSPSIKPLIYFLGILLVVSITYLLAQKHKSLYQNLLASENVRIDAFRMGASIYLGTSLIGNNFDYRLVFLLFSIPQLLAWLKARNHFSSISFLVMLGIILTTWLSRNSSQFFYLDEFINWLLFAFFIYTLILTLPKWLKNYP